MKSVFTVTAEDFLSAVTDTRYDLHVVGITDETRGGVNKKLRDLYGREFDAKDEVYIEGDDGLFKKRYSDGDLLHVMQRLTAEDGCPWDKAQTHESIRINAIEEAYELCDAIDAHDLANMEEEIGDLLLQAVFHMDIAERTGEFGRLDVINALVHKLVSRHTHIFGADKATDPDEALKFWEAAKATEKNARGLEEQLSRIPESFPALLKAQKVLKKLVKNGLINDAPSASARDLFLALCGCAKEGIDAEAELSKLVTRLKNGYLGGEVKAVSELTE